MLLYIVYLISYHLELPNTGIFNNQKNIDFGGWCGKKNTGVFSAVRSTSDILKWKKAFKQRSEGVQKAFGSVLEWKSPFRSSVSLEFGKIDRFWRWRGHFHDQENPVLYHAISF